MADSTDDDEYEIGYKRPPKHTQFPPGRSGNPAGRPKGSRNLQSIVREVAERMVTVNGPGGQREVSMLEVVVTQLANTAAKGDHRARQQFLQLFAMSEQEGDPNTGGVAPHQSDLAVMAGLIKRVQASTQPSQAEADKPSGEDDA